MTIPFSCVKYFLLVQTVSAYIAWAFATVGQFDEATSQAAGQDTCCHNNPDRDVDKKFSSAALVMIQRQMQPHPSMRTVPKSTPEWAKNGRAPECLDGTKVWWLHVPKCGTSFRESIKLCPGDATRAKLAHPPLPLNSHSVENVVAIFRMPSQRLASAFNFLGFTHGTCISWGCTEVQQGEIKKLVKENFTAANNDYLRTRFLGCQTNMVLGKKCMAGSPANPSDDGKHAVDRMNKFLHVGLLEEWGLSICLYNYKVTGQKFISDAQLEDDRPTNRAAGRKPTTYDTANYPEDKADEKLYAQAVNRFQREIKHYGISKRTCSFDGQGKPLDILVAEAFFASGSVPNFFEE